MSFPLASFPDVSRRRTIRGPVNPLDKSTIVSILPIELNETKPTIQPGFFHLDRGSYENPAILVIGPSSWWREIDEEQPLLEIPNSSIQVADSVVKDFCNGLLECDMDAKMPGLFFIPGAFTVEQIKKDHRKELDKARVRQNNWYEALVKMADALWSRTNGNPLVISDEMRLAARELGRERAWLTSTSFSSVELIPCIACGALRNAQYPICPSCKAIVDIKKAEALGLKFAQ